VNLVEIRQVKVRQRGGVVDPGGMDNDVETPEAVLDGVEESRCRRRLLVGEVRCECRAVPTVLLDLPDRRVGQVDAAGVGHCDIKPVGGQLGGYDPAHAAGPPGHQRRPYALSRIITCSHDPHLSAAAHRPAAHATAQCCRAICAAHRQVR
jgi:hypothetical protein